MITPRMQALQNLSGQLPVASQRIATGQKTARDIQLQQAVQAAPVTTQVAPTSQQLGAAVAQQAGEQAVQTAGQQLQQQGQIGQMGLAEQQRQQQSELASQQMGVREEQMSMEKAFAKLAGQEALEDHNNDMRISTDKLGRAMLSEKNVIDAAIVSARNQNQFEEYKQGALHGARKAQEFIEFAYSKKLERLTQAQRMAELRGDVNTAKQIARDKANVEGRIQRERTRAANRNAAWQAGGTIVGATAGAVIGGPQGAMIGGQAGGGLGSSAGTMFGGG